MSSHEDSKGRFGLGRSHRKGGGPVTFSVSKRAMLLCQGDRLGHLVQEFFDAAESRSFHEGLVSGNTMGFVIECAQCQVGHKLQASYDAEARTIFVDLLNE